MAKRKLTFRLGDDTSPFIRAYETFLERKKEEFLRRVADRLKELIEANFVGAIVDDVLPNSGGPRYASVTVADPAKDGDGYVVTVDSTDAVWVEFGAGVYHNGAVGSSPNPYGDALNFRIGEYGTKGQYNTWGFKEGEETILTHGTPARMPMYNAVQTLKSEIPQIAQEVFG